VLETWQFQRSWSSAESYEDLARFGVTIRSFMQDDITALVASKLRAVVQIDMRAIRAAVIGHLSGRIDDLEKSISVIRADIPDGYDDADDVYRVVQSDWWKELLAPDELRDQRFPVLGRTLELWRKQVRSLIEVDDRYEMYARYASIEDAFEPFERQVEALEEAIDRAVQQEIDERRGK
jgi:hypothetical protein